MQQAIQANSPTIAAISIVNQEVAKILLTTIITDLVLFLNVGKTMNVPQIQITVDLIMDDPVTKNLKPEDFKVCFDHFKKFGKTYDRIDGQVIFNEVYKYANERMELVENLAYQAHEQNKLKENLIAPEVIEMYKEILKLKLSNNKQTTAVKIEKIEGKHRYIINQVEGAAGVQIPYTPKNPAIEKSLRDIFMQQCLTDFDKIYFKGPDMNGVRFILYKGRQMDQAEYLDARVKEYDKQNLNQ